MVTRREPLEFRIKPGTRDGQRIRLAGKGNAGTEGAPAGDLYLIIRVGHHQFFRRVADREGSDPQAADYPYGEMGVEQRDRSLAGGR